MRSRLVLTWPGFLALSLVAAPLAGCGKIGSPALPPGAVSTFPRIYPSPKFDTPPAAPPPAASSPAASLPASPNGANPPGSSHS